MCVYGCVASLVAPLSTIYALRAQWWRGRDANRDSHIWLWVYTLYLIWILNIYTAGYSHWVPLWLVFWYQISSSDSSHRIAGCHLGCNQPAVVVGLMFAFQHWVHTRHSSQTFHLNMTSCHSNEILLHTASASCIMDGYSTASVSLHPFSPSPSSFLLLFSFLLTVWD